MPRGQSLRGRTQHVNNGYFIIKSKFKNIFLIFFSPFPKQYMVDCVVRILLTSGRQGRLVVTHVGLGA